MSHIDFVCNPPLSRMAPWMAVSRPANNGGIQQTTPRATAEVSRWRKYCDLAFSLDGIRR
jgi:hypothetical protein